MTLPCRQCSKPVKVKKRKDNRRTLTAMCKECRRESRAKFAGSTAVRSPFHEARLAAHVQRMEQIMAVTKAADINIASAEAGVVDEKLGDQVSFNQ